jgi:hypothetical protein
VVKPVAATLKLILIFSGESSSKLSKELFKKKNERNWQDKKGNFISCRSGGNCRQCIRFR